jgi:GTPase SAR1 family protein
VENLKCLVIGPPVCGKTSLIHTYMSGCFRGYIPHNIITRYDVNFVCKPNDSDKSLSFQFKLYDYEIEKSNSFQFLKDDELNQVDVILLCYQTFSDSSKFLLRTKFKSFIKEKWPNTPVLLVSCFSDLLKSNASSLIDDKLAFLDDDLNRLQILESDKSLMKEMGALKHYYCSALEKFNIDKLFRDAFKLAIKQRIYNNAKLISTSSKNASTNDSQELDIGKTKIENIPMLAIEASNVPPIIQLKKNIIDLENYKREMDYKQKRIQCMNTINNIEENKQHERSQKIKNSFSLARFLTTLMFLIFMIMYLLSIKYCTTNKEHCNEIYELTMEVIDDSMSSLNESYTNIVHQLERLS